MKFSKLSVIFSSIPIIASILWVILGTYFLDNADRRAYSGIYVLIDLVAIIMGCYYSFKAFKEKNSIYKIIGISLSCIYVGVILFMFIMNVIDVFNFSKTH